MKREKKAKQDHGTVFSTLCMVLFGAALGIFAGKDLFEIVEGVSFGEYLLHVAWLIVMMTAAFYLQTILHEGGHLVCGLLTGYRFVSFRIGSWMVQRENGRLRFHRYTLAGTAGQCLLAPPELTTIWEACWRTCLRRRWRAFWWCRAGTSGAQRCCLKCSVSLA